MFLSCQSGRQGMTSCVYASSPLDTIVSVLWSTIDGQSMDTISARNDWLLQPGKQNGYRHEQAVYLPVCLA